jgi:pimeloyl-ACP methyl ester carboxylesterase
MRSVRCIAIFLLVVLLPSVGGTARAAKQGGTQVYLLRGIFNVSVGLDALAAKLARRGIRSAVYGHGDAFAVAEQAIRDYRSGRVRSIILVGHSLGAGAAITVADQLNQAGIPVTLIVSLDPVGGTAVPANVRRVVNFYISRSGIPLAAAPGFRGSLRNIDMQNTGVDHMTIQSLDSMHQRIIGAITGG